MADESDHQLHNLPSTEGGTTFVSQTDDLTYPHLPLETSFDSLLNHSYISNTSLQDNMRSPTAQRPPPSLSESWASLSDPELSQDEDVHSERTDVGSLVDIRSVDEILSVQEDAATSDEGCDDDALPSYDESDVQDALHLEQSEQVLTVGTSLTETSLLPMHLTLDEPEVADGVKVTVAHIHKEFTKSEASLLGFDQAGDHGGLVGTIRTSLSKFSMRDGGRQSLHLLILGKDYVPSLRTSIVGKVADALVASTSSFDTSRPELPSRYHIVPDCFGPGSMPSAAEVIPIDCQLEVDSYHTAEFVDKRHQTIQLRDSTSSKTLQSVRHENSYTIDGEKSGKPDLAAIVVSAEDSSTNIEEICVMMIFAQRHAIPVLVISVDNGWGGESLPFPDPDSNIHRCIEYVTNGKDGPCKRLPLDLDTFLQLDPAQLSRHLAHIVQHPQGRTEERRISAKSPKQSPANHGLDVKQSYFMESLPSIRQIKDLWSRVPSWFLAALGIIFLLQAMIMWSLDESKMQAASSSNNTEVKALTPSSDVPMVTLSSIMTTAVDAMSTVTSIPLNVDATKSVAGKFEVEVVGDSHLVIRTSSKPSKKGPLTFTILKHGKSLDVETTLLIPHVYSVHVNREDMYGNLTIRLEATDGRSTDTVTIDLGQQPLDVWIKNMLETAESKLVDMAVHFQQEMEKHRQRGKQIGTVRGAQHLQTAMLKATRQVEQLTRPLRIKIAVVESRVQAWNERVDARGAELWLVAKATSSDLFIKGKHTFKQMKHTGHHLPSVSLRQFPNLLTPLQDVVSDLRSGRRFHRASHMLHGSTQSETLATAQDRAQQIMRFWQRAESETGRRRRE